MTSGTLVGSFRFVARPYEGIEALGQALDLTQIILAGTTYLPGTVAIPQDSLPVHGARIQVFIDCEGVIETLDSLGIPSGAVGIACIAFGSVIATSEVLFDEEFDSVRTPFTVDLAGKPLIFESPNGFDVRVVLYLRKGLRQKGFRPHRVGTWLAVATFSLTPFTSLSRFCPLPMDEELRAHLLLPVGCVSYVQVGEGLIDADSIEDEVEVYLDLDILRLLQENPDEPLARYIQIDLASATLVAIIQSAGNHLAAGHEYASFDDLRSARRPVAALIDEIARSASVGPERLLAATQDDPGLVRSCVETHVNSLKATSRALREVQ